MVSPCQEWESNPIFLVQLLDLSRDVFVTNILRMVAVNNNKQIFRQFSLIYSIEIAAKFSQPLRPK